MQYSEPIAVGLFVSGDVDRSVVRMTWRATASTRRASDTVARAMTTDDIALRIGDSGTPGDEGYQLDVTTANTTVTR